MSDKLNRTLSALCNAKVVLSTVTNLDLVTKPLTYHAAVRAQLTWLQDISEDPMTTTRAWNRNRDMWVRVLEKQTGEGVNAWNRRIVKEGLRDERRLRAWLTRRRVTGYAQSLLVMERFGYPDFVLATANELIDRQYADRLELRRIYDAVVDAATSCGEVIIQARKTCVSLVSPRRTFARVQPTTRTRVDLGLRLEGRQPGGRLQPSTMHETMRLQVGLTAPADVNAEVRRWLQQAYSENC